MDRRVRSGLKPRIAIVGGGYGGVELAACVKRRLKDCDVTLLTRGSPMKGTRAEPLVDKALSRLGVTVEICGVKAVEKLESAPDDMPKDKVKIIRTSMDDEDTSVDDDLPFDAVLWTAGSGPAYPVCDGMLGLKQVEGSGRLEIDSTLRCIGEDSMGASRKPPVWALGDCSQIVDATGTSRKGLLHAYPIFGFTEHSVSLYFRFSILSSSQDSPSGHATSRCRSVERTC
jgi:NADH dehydrogenase FAD-containing subunit